MNEPVQSYRELKVWQQSIDLVEAIYAVVRQLPKSETYALGDQLRRAVVSIPANIAEGQSRQHTREFIQFLSVAKGSLAETETLLIVAQRVGYLEPVALERLERQIADLRRPLQTLINRLQSRNPS